MNHMSSHNILYDSQDMERERSLSLMTSVNSSQQLQNAQSDFQSSLSLSVRDMASGATFGANIAPGNMISAASGGSVPTCESARSTKTTQGTQTTQTTNGYKDPGSIGDPGTQNAPLPSVAMYSLTRSELTQSEDVETHQSVQLMLPMLPPPSSAAANSDLQSPHLHYSTGEYSDTVLQPPDKCGS